MTSARREGKKLAAYLVFGVTLAAFLLLVSFADWASLIAEVKLCCYLVTSFDSCKYTGSILQHLPLYMVLSSECQD